MPGAKNYSGTARFSLSGLAKSCLGPKITPKQCVSLCVASLSKLFRRSQEAPWGVPQDSGKMARFSVNFNRIYIAEMTSNFLELWPSCGVPQERVSHPKPQSNPDQKMDPRVLVASQMPGAKNYSGTARFSLSGLAKSCLGPKITPKQCVSLCVASLSKLLRRSQEAPWGVPQDSGKMARFSVNFK